MLKPKLYLVIAILGILAIVGGACAQPVPTPSPTPTPTPTPTPPPAPTYSTLQVYVTDAPPREEVTSIMVTVSEVQVHKALAEQEMEQEQSGSDNQTQTQEEEREQQQTQQGEGEWITINLSDNKTTFDLLQIKGIEQSLGASEVATGKYTQVRLVVDTIKVALGDREPQDAEVPSKELKIVHPFDVAAGETTAMILDFDADKMVTVTGAGKIIVKPVIKLTVRQEKSTSQKNGQGPDKEITEKASVEVSCNDFMSVKHISKELEVNVGDFFMVTLCSNPTTGFEWELKEITDQTILEFVESKYEPGKEAKQKPPIPGAGGNEVWTFKTLKEGEATISMEYSQPWEGGEKAEWTLALTMVVK